MGSQTVTPQLPQTPTQQPQAAQPQDSLVTVKGPDGKTYRFPSGTDKQTAVQYFKTKGVKAAAQPQTAQTAQPASAAGGIPTAYGFTPGNMARNLYEGSKLLVTGSYEMGKDLLSNPNWLTGKDSTAQKFVYGPADAEYAKAKQAYHEHRYSEAFGHGGASLIPFIGPMAAQLGEQAGTGDIGGAISKAAGMLVTGVAGAKVIDAATGFVDPKALNQRAAELNTKALKQAQTGSKDFKLSAGLQVAQEHIIGTMRDLPAKIETKRAAKQAQIVQLAKQADATGVTVDASATVQPVLRDTMARLNAQGLITGTVRNQLRGLIDRITTQVDMRTGGTIPRNLNNLKVSEALELTKGLGDLSSFGKDVPKPVEVFARQIRGAINEAVGKASPNIQRLRGEESRLITAREAANKNLVELLNGKTNTARGVLYSGAGTIGLYLGLRALGTLPMATIGTVVLLRAMATSVKSRTIRASLYARAAELLDSSNGKNPAAGSVTSPQAGPPNAGGPQAPPGPQTPQGGLPAPAQGQLPQAAQTLNTVGSAAGAARDTALFQQARTELGPQAGISDIAKRAQELKLHAASADVGTGGTSANASAMRPTPPALSTGSYGPPKTDFQMNVPHENLGFDPNPPKDYGAASRADVERRMGGPLPRGVAEKRATPSVAKSNITPPVTRSVEGTSGVSPRSKAMLDRLDTLLERQDNPKSGADRVALAREIKELKQILAGEDTGTLDKGAPKRIADRERLAAKRQQVASQQTDVAGASAANAEGVASTASPETRVIALDAGYKALARYEGGPEMVKALRGTAKAMQSLDPSYDEVEKLTEALTILREQQ